MSATLALARETTQTPPPTTWWGVLGRAADQLTVWHRQGHSPAGAKDEDGRVDVVRVLWLVADPRNQVPRQFSTTSDVGQAVRRAAAAIAAVGSARTTTLMDLAVVCRRAAR